ncbi:hypothetical protein N752_16010 [Desulforamulus aquiferis]|nr:hypothetical protein N752_16010 [Desulforamulus aquiferis]
MILTDVYAQEGGITSDNIEEAKNQASNKLSTDNFKSPIGC